MENAIRHRVFENPDSASAQAAANIAQLIRERATLGRNVVLGLATGRTVLPLYEELIYLYQEEGLSFGNVVTFNLDEYLGLPSGHAASFRSFMHRHFFDHVDIPVKNIHFLPGLVPQDKIASTCSAYEKEIKAAGGIDIQILGIGRNGHIGFNEPGSDIESVTRPVQLDEQTRDDLALNWTGTEKVPTRALTMGCKTIMGARNVIMMAWGSRKRRIVRRAVEGEVTSRVPASYLQTHPAVRVFLDPPAAALLRRKPSGPA